GRLRHHSARPRRGIRQCDRKSPLAPIPRQNSRPTDRPIQEVAADRLIAGTLPLPAPLDPWKGLAMDSFLIRGSRPLRGTVDISGSKNSALPILAACLMGDGVTTLHG